MGYTRCLPYLLPAGGRGGRGVTRKTVFTVTPSCFCSSGLPYRLLHGILCDHKVSNADPARVHPNPGATGSSPHPDMLAAPEPLTHLSLCSHFSTPPLFYSSWEREFFVG